MTDQADNPAPAFDPSRLQITASPHLRHAETVPDIMWWVVFTLLPACAWACYGYGLEAFWTIATAVGAAMATEGIIQKLRRVPVTLNDKSALLTGLLLALTIPPVSHYGQLYQVALGSVFAIGIAKQAFGGLGNNIVNPALAGRAFMLASWPGTVGLARYPGWGPDGVTKATVLAQFNQGEAASVDFWSALLGQEGGALGEVSAALILIGGLVLLARKIIDWQTPFFFILTAAVMVFLLPHKMAGGGYTPWLGLTFAGSEVSGIVPQLKYVGFHVVSGGLFLGAFYMATDMVTSPLTRKGKIVFACGCGFLTVLIRLFGGYPEGVCYSILLMNLTVPLIDSWCRPPIMGARKKKKDA